MTKQNLKAVYAEGNAEWRIVYHMNGRWKLQQHSQLPDGADRSREQPWRDHNTSMTFDDAIVALNGHAIKKAA